MRRGGRPWQGGGAARAPPLWGAARGRGARAVRGTGFLVVQELFLTATARAADVVFPAQAFTEREGSVTPGDRRAQRFYPAVPPLPATRPDWQILAGVGAALGLALEGGA